MKRILLYIIFALVPMFLLAQKPFKAIWTEPEFPKSDAMMSIFVDVTGSDLEGIEDPIYLWAWYPTEPDKGNWANSSEFAKLTKVEGNVWKMSFVPATYFKTEAVKITEIYGLFKTKTGSKSTDAFAPDKGNAIKIDNTPTPIVVDPPIIAVFPQKFTKRDIFYISRKNNEANVSALNYEIRVENQKVGEGKFEGSKSEYKAYINLIDVLSTSINPTKIKVSLIDNFGATVSEMEFPLY